MYNDFDIKGAVLSKYDSLLINAYIHTVAAVYPFID